MSGPRTKPLWGWHKTTRALQKVTTELKAPGEKPQFQGGVTGLRIALPFVSYSQIQHVQTRVLNDASRLHLAQWSYCLPWAAQAKALEVILDFFLPSWLKPNLTWNLVKTASETSPKSIPFSPHYFHPLPKVLQQPFTWQSRFCSFSLDQLELPF